MNFSDVIGFLIVMFTYVLPALLTFLVLLWFKDRIVKIAAKWRRAADKRYELMREDRWFVMLEMMKIVLFIILLLPLLEVINYATNEDASDPAPEIFQSTMPSVFIVVTLWYLLASVIYGIYWKNKQDIEREEEGRLLQGAT